MTNLLEKLELLHIETGVDYDKVDTIALKDHIREEINKDTSVN